MSLLYKSKGTKHISIGEKEFEIEIWTAKNQREYLSLIEKKKENTTDKDIFDTLIKSCIIKGSEYLLTPSEQKYLLVEIRKESLGDTIKEKDHECPKCKELHNIEVKYDDVTEYRPANYSAMTVDDVTITFAELDAKKSKERDKLNTKEGLVNYVFDDFLLHIEKIEMDGEVYDKFTLAELREFSNSLPSKIFEEFFEGYQKMVDSLDIKFNDSCPHCGEVQEISYDSIPNFLWS
ncbi:MAG: T4 family baseplate hub assembly chaperone [Sulfuricurvum sp.]